MLLTILLVIIGGIALFKGELKLTKNRHISQDNARILGFMLIIGAFIFPLAAGLFILAVGWSMSEKIEDDDHPDKAKNTVSRY